MMLNADLDLHISVCMYKWIEAPLVGRSLIYTAVSSDLIQSEVSLIFDQESSL